ncbi:MAG: HAD-IC family P-type ATPase [Anaeromyxobacter sp.]|nr:HAD-IC family P-type ATPase [Anaeromyxobacter sp.]
MTNPPPAGAQPSWHALSADDALARTGSASIGLSSDEAARRLATHGPNLLVRSGGDGGWRILWRQVDSPLILVLVGAAVVAALLGEVTDAAVVGAVVVLNTLIGFFQEYRASRAIEALAGMVPENATVVRDGARRGLPVAELVPGDLVVLASGDKVPADLRLLAVKGLRVEEAALTGESVPADKDTLALPEATQLGDRRCLAFAGTLVSSGTATGLVVGTGQATELGRISGLLTQAESLETPLTRALAQVGKAITWSILALTVVMLAVGTWRSVGQGVALGDALREMLVFSISLAVGAIPEGLPAIVTIALAIGVQRMAARRAIIRKLPAVETLGATSVICSDKTGTLTRNEMTVQVLWTPAGTLTVEGHGWAPAGRFLSGGQPVAPGPEARDLLAAGAVCNDATVEPDGGGFAVAGDPTEAALVVAARKAGLETAPLRAGAPRLDAIPFESEHQYMATLHRWPDGRRRLVVKGAPEVVLARCAARAGGGALAPEAVLAEVEGLAARGMRVLAVAARAWDGPGHELGPADVAGGLELLGLVGMIDPPRQEAVEAVAACRAAGIRVKMITGDHRGTAQAIGRQLGLLAEGEEALTGAELSATSDEDLKAVATTTHVFARVSPEHKLRLVRALQRSGQVVAMTGDGVNDAPALKQSDIGVAMGITGTSVSKEAADMVLTDDNFATIVAAVEEGRRVYDNLVKSLAFVLPTNLGLALIFVCAVFAFPFDAATQTLLLPVRPTQLLWINLVAAVALALPLAFEAKERDVMRRPPRPPREPILSTLVLRRTVVAAVLMTAGSVGLFLWEWHHALAAGESPALALAEAQTLAVTSVIFFQVLYLMESRSLTRSLFASSIRDNPAVLLGVAAILGLQALFVYAPFMHRVFGTAPLALADLGRAALVASVILPVMVVEKLVTRRAKRPASGTVAAPPTGR